MYSLGLYVRTLSLGWMDGWVDGGGSGYTIVATCQLNVTEVGEVRVAEINRNLESASIQGSQASTATSRLSEHNKVHK